MLHNFLSGLPEIIADADDVLFMSDEDDRDESDDDGGGSLDVDIQS